MSEEMERQNDENAQDKYFYRVFEAVYVRKDIAKFLTGLHNNVLRRIYGSCIVDGMDFHELQEYARQDYTEEQLIQKKKEHWQRKFMSIEPELLKIRQEMESVRKDFENLKVQDEKIERMYEDRIELMKQQYDARIHEYAQHLEDVRSEKDRQIVILQESSRKSADRAAELENGIRQMIDRLQESGKNTAAPAQQGPVRKKKHRWFRNDEEDTERVEQRTTPEDGLIHLTENERNFQRKILEDDDFSDEQISFFCSCFRDGDTAEDILTYANPVLDVGTMKKFRSVMKADQRR